MWKGTPGGTATLEVVVDNPIGSQPLRHTIEFAELSQKFELLDEQIENATPYPGYDKAYFYYRFQQGRPVLCVRGQGERSLRREDVSLDESILSQRKDPDQYPEITLLILDKFMLAFASIASGHSVSTLFRASRRKRISPMTSWNPIAATSGWS